MENFNFRTKIEIAKSEANLNFNSKIMLLGSCFTTEIGKMLADYKFDVCTNPFGVLYNPCSIANSIKRMLCNKQFRPDDIIQTNPTDHINPKLYASFYHHSSFAKKDANDFLAEANRALLNASNSLLQCDTLIITLGTAWVYTHLQTNEIVSNCHKHLAKEFRRDLLTVEECTKTLTRIADALPQKRIIFTVSPIRHFRDGAHGNQISKSTLLLAIDAITSKYSNCSYFPSFEIMMDELRDYRYYAEDMLHPSPLAIKYIFEKFKESYISPLSYEQMERNMRLTRAENHRAR